MDIFDCICYNATRFYSVYQVNALSTQFAGLKTIKEIIKEFGIQPTKALGQNFLLDGAIPDRMVLHAGNLSGKTIIEVGPGPGILTRSLLASQAKKVIAIEMDERCLRALTPLQEMAPDRLQLLQNDALRIDWGNLIADKYSVIANLPYNIATPLLINWMAQGRIEQIIVMIQKEVAQRFCATPSDDGYGRLSVLTQSRWHAEILFDVAPEEFFPPPKVNSSVIRFAPCANPLDDITYKKLEKVCTIAFAHRRKMVRAALKKIFPEAELTLTEIGARPDSRAEQLTLAQYISLARMLK